MTFFEPPPLKKALSPVSGQTSINGGGGDVLIEGLTFDRQLLVENFRHLIIRGCEVRLKPSDTTSGAGITLRYAKDSVAHLEGNLVDCALCQADAVRSYGCPGGTVQIANSVHLRPGYGTVRHGDIFHAQGDGPLAKLLIDTLEGWTGGQGIFCPFQVGNCGARYVRIDNCILGWHPDATFKRMSLLYLGSGDTGRDKRCPDGANLRNVGFDMTRTKNYNGETFASRVAYVGDLTSGYVQDWTGKGMGYILNHKKVGLAYVGATGGGGGGNDGGNGGGGDGGAGNGGVTKDKIAQALNEFDATLASAVNALRIDLGL